MKTQQHRYRMRCPTLAQSGVIRRGSEQKSSLESMTMVDTHTVSPDPVYLVPRPAVGTKQKVNQRSTEPSQSSN